MHRPMIAVLLLVAGSALAQQRPPKLEPLPEAPPPPAVRDGADEPRVRIEPQQAAELPFYLDLMAHLARHGIPCPAPIADLGDRYLSTLNGKPAALVTRLAGASIEQPGEGECAELGALLARMHLAARSFGGYLENPRGPKWWRFAAGEVTPFLEGSQGGLLASEMRYQSRQRFVDLPRGAVHADPFRDNAFFLDGRVSGVFDLYFAGGG